MTKTIHLSIEDADFTEIGNLTNLKELRSVIGYFCTWGLHYPHVSIHRVQGTKLIAHYYKSEKTQHPSYTIGAIWRNNVYETHS